VRSSLTARTQVLDPLCTWLGRHTVACLRAVRLAAMHSHAQVTSPAPTMLASASAAAGGAGAAAAATASASEGPTLSPASTTHGMADGLTAPGSWGAASWPVQAGRQLRVPPALPLPTHSLLQLGAPQAASPLPDLGQGAHSIFSGSDSRDVSYEAFRAGYAVMLAPIESQVILLPV
jgi:hypothetical protein